MARDIHLIGNATTKLHRTRLFMSTSQDPSAHEVYNGYNQAVFNSGFMNFTNFALILAMSKFRIVQFVRIEKLLSDGEYTKLHQIIAPLQEATRMQIMMGYS